MNLVYLFLLSLALSKDQGNIPDPEDMDLGDGRHHGIHNPKIDAATLLDDTLVETIESSSDLLSEMLGDVNNLIIVTTSKSVIINKLKLNSARRVGGDDIVTLTQEEEKEVAKVWIEVKATQSRLIEGKIIPVTGCLSNEFGDGGVLSGGVTKTFGKTATLDLPMAFELIGYILPLQPVLDYKLEAASMVSVSFNYNCAVPRGKVGQIFLQPFEVEFLEVQLRELRLEGRSKRIVRGEWEDVEEDVRIPSIREKPRIMCITEKEKLECF